MSREIFKEDEIRNLIEEMRVEYNGCLIDLDRLRLDFKIEALELVLEIHGCEFDPVKFSWSPGKGGIAQYVTQ